MKRRSQRRSSKVSSRSFSNLMEIVGNLQEGSTRLAKDYDAALKRSGDILSDALRD